MNVVIAVCRYLVAGHIQYHFSLVSDFGLALEYCNWRVASAIVLLQFLGFPSVEFVEPTGKILEEPRYREGRRGTFIALRS